jgi:hypothetical protein
MCKGQNETGLTMKEVLTFKGCYFCDDNADNHDNDNDDDDDDDDVDDDCDERKRRLYLA